MILCDTGPLVLAINRGERRRHRVAAELLARLGRKVVFPCPVFVEVDLLLRALGYPQAALTFAQSLKASIHRLETPSAAELLALDLARRYSDSGAELPDLIVMATASRRRARILTWDYRHFLQRQNAVGLRNGLIS